MRRIRLTFVLLHFIVFGLAGPSLAEDKTQALETMRLEIEELQRQLEFQKTEYEEKLTRIQQQLDEVAASSGAQEAPAEAEEALEAEIAKKTTEASIGERFETGARRVAERLNPEISAIVDGNYYNASDKDVWDFYSSVAGFGDGHGGHDHDHSHGDFREGFNLREVELYLAAAVDPYFKGYVTVAVTEDDTELEEAVVQTTSLPAGFQAKGLKFFSDFGYINRQHPHEWNFVDRPLIYELALGDHGLQEKGLQVSWLAPTSFNLLFGVEALQGENERMFDYIGGDKLPDKDGPRIGVGWVKLAPNLPQKHGLQLGLFGAFGVHQEVHSEEAHHHEDDEHEDDEHEGDEHDEHEHEDEHEGEEVTNYLDGNSYFCGADVVYKYDTGRAYGHGDFTLQGEYFYRKKDLDVKYSEEADLIGSNREDKQDGFYVQAVYGLFPRLRAGLRYDMVGLTNEIDFPTGEREKYDESSRITGMLDFSPTEFSRFRAQVQRGDFELAGGGSEDFWQFYVQAIFSLGAHGAHKW